MIAPVILMRLAMWDVQAQVAPAPLTFDVASIKPSPPDIGGLFGPTQSGGNFRVRGATLKNLIFFAYNVREFAVSGGPGWVGADRFDVNARAEHSSASENSPADPKKVNAQFRERLKSLLSERFRLAVHTESKEQNVYALVVGKNGPKFREAIPESGRMIRGRRGSIIAQGVPIFLLVTNLSYSLDGPVVDKTGLTGKYDFKLEWTPDSGAIAAVPTAGGTSALPELNGPTLFTAIQEQLGLRLEAQKAPVEVLVIDHAERPTEN